jgi:hypothetical protein
MKLYTKYFLFFILAFTILKQNAHAQIFKCEPVTGRDAELAPILKKYDLVRIPFKDISSYVKGRANGSSITIVLEGKKHEWNIYENNLLSPDFKVHKIEGGKDVNVEIDKRCRTYIGYKNDSGKEARFTITPRTFMAMMPYGDNTIYIQQLKDFNKNAENDLFVVYHAGDAIDEVPHSCSVKERTHHEDPAPLPHESTRVKKPRSYNCLELEVTMATDWSMDDEFDSLEAIIDFQLTVLQHVEHHYLSDFDLDFRVQDYYYGTSYPSLWGEDYEVDELLPSFGDWAYAHFNTEDIGHLWTTIDLHDDDNFNIIGYAGVGGACSDIGLYPWAILERFTPLISKLALLQAHEYGHLLDADHEPGTGTIMEPSLSAVTCACWAQDNIEEMWDFIEDETCIETCVRCPFTYNIIDNIAWGNWKYSSQLSTTSTGFFFNEADVILQSEGYVRLLPGFNATSLSPASGGATLIARIEGCE